MSDYKVKYRGYCANAIKETTETRIEKTTTNNNTTNNNTTERIVTNNNNMETRTASLVTNNRERIVNNREVNNRERIVNNSDRIINNSDRIINNSDRIINNNRERLIERMGTPAPQRQPQATQIRNDITVTIGQGTVERAVRTATLRNAELAAV